MALIIDGLDDIRSSNSQVACGYFDDVYFDLWVVGYSYWKLRLWPAKGASRDFETYMFNGMLPDREQNTAMIFRAYLRWRKWS